MKENFEIEFDNLTEEDKEKFLEIVEKAKIPIKKRWRGKKRDIYYSIADTGYIISIIESETSYDNACYEFGNYFETITEVNFARARRLTYQRLSDYALMYNTEKIDWENPYSSKFCIAYDYDNKKLFIDDMQTVKYPNTVYFTSKKIAENAIKAIGEETIKYYLFGIKD